MKCFDIRSQHHSMQNYLEYLKYSGLNYSQYQYDGVKWMIEKEQEVGTRKGGIIADEMGLGKTIMMIGTFVSNILPKTLIVLPLILIEQWKQQILKTTGYNVIVYHGITKPDISSISEKKLVIILTTYHTLIRSSELHQIQWNRIVFDEAHHLRNQNTQCFHIACQLKTSICWLITGTPIQNSIKDLRNLCLVARIPFELFQDFMLKRTKKEVGLEMPDLKEYLEIIQWRENTREHKLGTHFHRLLNDPNVGGCKLPRILRAKQVCILPNMVNKMELLNEIETLVIDTESSKIDRAIQIIVERKMNGNQKIVFCHFRAEINIIMTHLKNAGMTVGVLDGRSKCTVSQVDQNDVLIIQIQTGCEGLNLQRFNEIYFIGPHWNPSVEDQAIARCHRLGQLKPVFVYRFIMEELDLKDLDEDASLDMYIRSIQEGKRNMARDILSPLDL